MGGPARGFAVACAAPPGPCRELPAGSPRVCVSARVLSARACVCARVCVCVTPGCTRSRLGPMSILDLASQGGLQALGFGRASAEDVAAGFRQLPAVKKAVVRKVPPPFLPLSVSHALLPFSTRLSFSLPLSV